jgi:DNA-binding transcriptional MerR regulator
MKSFDAAGTGTARPILSISAVARMLGVPVATIRTWEDRYGLVVPDRNASGHRLYSRDQFEQLRFAHARMAEGLSAADAHRLLAEWLDRRPEQAGPPGQASPEQAGPPTPAVPAQAAVLLAERDPYTAELQEHFLRTEGFDVEVVLSGEAALGALTVRPPAVAIIELLISGGTGLDLCRSFKRHGVPVIAASVLRSRDQALEAGADAFLRKPLDPAQLASAIRELLSMNPQLRPEQEAAS